MNNMGNLMVKSLVNPYLVIRNLTKSFGNFEAVKNINIDIHEGEFACFLGPSGCGKTTLLRCIAGLEMQTTGSIKQKNKDISLLPPSARDFGIVFQSYALFPNLSVFSNISYEIRQRANRVYMPYKDGEIIKNHFQMSSPLSQKQQDDFYLIGNHDDIKYLLKENQLRLLREFGVPFNSDRLKFYEVIFK